MTKLSTRLAPSKPLLTGSCRKLGPGVRIGASLGLLYFVLRRVPLDGVVATLTRLDPWLVAGAGALLLMVTFVASYKWQLLMRAMSLRVPYAQVATTYFVGLFFNNFLPTGFGGDAMRAYRIARRTGRGADAVVSVGFDRLHSLWALLLLAGPCCVVSAASLGLPSWLGLVIILGTAGAAAVVGRFLSPAIHERLRTYLGLLPSIVARLSHPLLLPFERLSSDRRSLAWPTVVALCYQILNVAVHYILFVALGVGISFPTLVTVMTVAMLATMLPVSVNGIGLREGVYVVLLGRLGIPAAAALSLSLLGFGLMALVSVIGGVAFLIDDRRIAQGDGQKQDQTLLV